jgi:hypothetical protein
MIFLQSTAQILLATLREIFDEAAYSRFLHRGGLAPSRQSYAAFWREREACERERVRCC